MTLDKSMIIEDIKKLPTLFIGFFLCSYGIAQMKAANIGMNCWGTLNLGLVEMINIEFGKVTQVVGIVVILISVILKIYPGIGTLLNMYFIGLFIDIIDKVNIVWQTNHYLLKLISLLWGLLIFNYGVYVYIKQELGAGPRDGLMVGLIKITGFSATYVKTTMEFIVLVIGYLLGGIVGVGTIVVTFFGGYLLDKIFLIKNFDPKKTNQRKLFDYVNASVKENA